MITYDKKEVRAKLNIENIFSLLEEWGGEPVYTDFGILSSTICHNPPGEGSKKLYYYTNTDLFQCWTGCGTFDIFELLQKIAKIQWNKDYDLNDAVRYIAIKFGLSGYIDDIEKDSLLDWRILESYDRIQDLEVKDYHVNLKAYDNTILQNLNYNVIIKPWEDEGISRSAIQKAQIGYFPPNAQISIPHFDKNGNFIGLRGRTLVKEDAERYGKYRPLIVQLNGKPFQFNHPLGMNLYNLNNSKDNIQLSGMAIVFEAEKSCLKYQSYFGFENDISVACCGSNISAYQVQLLLDCGAKEMVIAFDRQWEEKFNDEYNHWIKNLEKLNERYKNSINISIIYDKNMLTGYKDSPCDCGAEIFL
jgi:DNA primase